MKQMNIVHNMGGGSGRVESGQTFCRHSRVGSGRVGSGRVNVSSGRVQKKWPVDNSDMEVDGERPRGKQKKTCLEVITDKEWNKKGCGLQVWRLWPSCLEEEDCEGWVLTHTYLEVPWDFSQDE